METLVEPLQDLVDQACRAGADAADAVAVQDQGLSVSYRLRQLEEIEQAESLRVGLRVIVGGKQATVSWGQLDPAHFSPMVEKALAQARVLPQDPYCGLADPDMLATDFPSIDSLDPEAPSTSWLQDEVRACEEAARGVSGVTNSQGASGSWGRETIALVASNGFIGTRSSSLFGLGAGVIAGTGDQMQQDYFSSRAVFKEDLEDSPTVGRLAGERAVRHIGARKVKTCQVPVVYDPLISGSLLRLLITAISGTTIVRQGSFLQGALGEQVFPKGLCIIDDPHRQRGFGSRAFDGEGLQTVLRPVVEDGVLCTWLLNLRTARQLNLSPTGHGTLALGGGPQIAPSNFYMEPGVTTPDELIADIQEGFFVTSLLGNAINILTGDYSIGASGFWIEGGKITYPVEEVTLAGRLRDMFAHLTPANDLQFRSSVNAPTIRVEGMTVGGL